MRRRSTICIAVVLSSISACAEPVINLVPDCSFESPLPLWFEPIWYEQKGNISCAFTKEDRQDAPDGNSVMSIQGWSQKGSLILSPVIEVSDSTVSFSAMMRASGNIGAISCEIALYDASGKTQIAAFDTPVGVPTFPAFDGPDICRDLSN